ncbi:orotidine-5'-phosphate decarboxylase [Roseiarcaceae bacterium H3SJ34-1]|uniref:orotidine-5'-phosphate decarboxylase n=1 Tax=Terripilifer ovatus TaxID=3032367 RepID=UPI003AB949FE|nr:orotidine-5'-phosphate decarboxylase [Roseiarcaceae bacterium H3SJ34-1]
MLASAISPRDRMIVALDLPSVKEARAMVDGLGDTVSFYKIGMELTYSGGLPLARELVREGKKVFLDLKLHDIPNTVTRATAQVAELGATFLTVHAYQQTMRAAVAGLGGSKLRLLAVTVLTSYDDADLREAGFALSVRDLVIKRSLQARECGIDGIVLSAEEAEALRPIVGPDVLLVTPGIRPSGFELADQKRVMTPGRAIAAGVDYLVIGRPVTQAKDPKAAAEALLAEIEQAAA